MHRNTNDNTHRGDGDHAGGPQVVLCVQVCQVMQGFNRDPGREGSDVHHEELLQGPHFRGRSGPDRVRDALEQARRRLAGHEDGFSDAQIQELGRWSSSTMVAKYARGDEEVRAALTNSIRI
jgi:hypothetical protein